MVLPEDSSSLFAGLPNLLSVDASGCDTTQVQNMSNIFNGCEMLTSLDLSGWNTANVQSYDNMFGDCGALSEFTVGTSYQFNGADMMPDSKIRKWWSETEKIWKTNQQIIDSCNGRADTYRIIDTWGECAWEIDDQGMLTVYAGEGTDSTGQADHWFPWSERGADIKAAVFKEGVILPENCSYLLYGCSNLVSADLSGCNAAGVSNMESLFHDCSALESLDLSGWDTSN